MLASSVAVTLSLVAAWGARRLAWQRTRERGRKRLALSLAVLAVVDAGLGVWATLRHRRLTAWTDGAALRTAAALDAAAVGAPVVLVARAARGNEVLTADRVLEVECDEKSGACLERLAERFVVSLDGAEIVVEGRGYERVNWPVEKWNESAKHFVAIDQPLVIGGDRRAERAIEPEIVFVGEHGDFVGAMTRRRLAATVERVVDFGAAAALGVGALLAFALRRRGLEPAPPAGADDSPA